MENLNIGNSFKTSMSSAGNIIDVLEELIEQMDIVSRNPMKPTLGVEERFGIQRGYYEQDDIKKVLERGYIQDIFEVSPSRKIYDITIDDTEAAKVLNVPPPKIMGVSSAEQERNVKEYWEKLYVAILEDLQNLGFDIIHVDGPTAYTIQEIEYITKKEVGLLEKDDIYSLALSFQDSLNRGKHTNPTYLSGVGEVEAEAILRSKVFDVLEEVGFGVNYINISYSPTDLGVRIEGEGQEMTFYYYAVGDEWKLVDVEVE
jgi:hypothetical protein